jgi:hypothetical protein
VKDTTVADKEQVTDVQLHLNRDVHAGLAQEEQRLIGAKREPGRLTEVHVQLRVRARALQHRKRAGTDAATAERQWRWRVVERQPKHIDDAVIQVGHDVAGVDQRCLGTMLGIGTHEIRTILKPLSM